MHRCEYCKEAPIGSKRHGDDIVFLCTEHYATVWGQFPQLFEPSTEGEEAWGKISDVVSWLDARA